MHSLWTFQPPIFTGWVVFWWCQRSGGGVGVGVRPSPRKEISNEAERTAGDVLGRWLSDVDHVVKGCLDGVDQCVFYI